MFSIYRILGCPIAESPTSSQLKDLIEKAIRDKKGFYTVAINAEKISYYKSDSIMREVIEGAGIPFADGSGALLGLRLLHKVKTKKINMPVSILEICNSTQIPLYMLGAGEETIGKSIENVKKKYTTINLAGYSHGYFSNEQKLIDQIKSSGAKIVMIAMGSPKQEILAGRMLEQLPDCVFVGCGGAFDILAGTVNRAPEWIQNAHIEWLFRLFQDPRRIKRQIILPLFFFRLIKEKISCC